MTSQDRKPTTRRENDETEMIGMGLERICQSSGIEPNRVKSVVELGCGFGRISGVSLQVFTGAVLHVIDQQRILKVNDRRLVFHPGAFVEVLSSGEIAPAEVLIMVEMGAVHGFNKDNIQLVGQGIKAGGRLITAGDNSKIAY